MLHRHRGVMLVSERDRSCGAVEVATGLSRPVVRRVLLILQHLGCVTTAAGRWTLTPRVLSIGQHYTTPYAITELAQPYLMQLTEKTGESATLATLDSNEACRRRRVRW